MFRNLPRYATVVSGKCPVIESPDNWCIAEAKKLGMGTKEWPIDNSTVTAPYGTAERRRQFTAAAYARNQQIVDDSDFVVAFKTDDDLTSKKRGGTGDTISRARAKKLPWILIHYDERGNLCVHSSEGENIWGLKNRGGH
jgi:hypothetical protein